MYSSIEGNDRNIEIEDINELLEEICSDPAFINGFESYGYFALIQSLISFINDVSDINLKDLNKYVSEEFKRIEQIANSNQNSQTAKFCTIVLLVQMYSLAIRIAEKSKIQLEDNSDDFGIEIQKNLDRFIEILIREIDRKVKDYSVSYLNEDVSEIGRLESELKDIKNAIHKEYKKRDPYRLFNISTNLAIIISEAREIRIVSNKYMEQINRLRFSDFYSVFSRRKDELKQYLSLQVSPKIKTSRIEM